MSNLFGSSQLFGQPKPNTSQNKQAQKITITQTSNNVDIFGKPVEPNKSFALNPVLNSTQTNKLFSNAQTPKTNAFNQTVLPKNEVKFSPALFGNVNQKTEAQSKIFSNQPFNGKTNQPFNQNFGNPAKNSPQFATVTPAPVFQAKPAASNSNQLETLTKRVKQLEQKYEKSQQNYRKVKEEFDTYRTSSQEKFTQLEELRTEVYRMKDRFTASQSMALVNNQSNSQAKLIQSLNQSISQLKLISNKKQTQLQKSIEVSSVQTKLIQILIAKTEKLQNKIQTKFLNNQNLSGGNNLSIPQNSFANNWSNNMSNSNVFPNMPRNSTSLFNNQTNQVNFKKNPLSRSTVQLPTFLNQSSCYTQRQDGYIIQYNTVQNIPVIASISNQHGRIQLIQNQGPDNIYLPKHLKSKSISNYVRIAENCCEFIDPSWEIYPARLITYNFMGYRNLSSEQRLLLYNQIVEQSVANGLVFERMDPVSGDLCILTRK